MYLGESGAESKSLAAASWKLALQKKAIPAISQRRDGFDCDSISQDQPFNSCKSSVSTFLASPNTIMVFGS